MLILAENEINKEKFETLPRVQESNISDDIKGG